MGIVQALNGAPNPNDSNWVVGVVRWAMITTLINETFADKRRLRNGTFRRSLNDGAADPAWSKGGRFPEILFDLSIKK